MRELSCDECLDLCPEVALGVAGAEERAAVLAHVERCRSCLDELASSSDVADLLYVLVPPADPPDGFAARVVDAISGAPGRVPDARSTRRSFRRPLSVAAAVVLAAAIGVGGWLAADSGSPAPVAVQTAALVSHGRAVGQVTTAGGGKPWISVTVRLRVGTTVVRCEVEDAGGPWRAVGTFGVHDGRGYWAAQLPHDMSVRRAELTTDRGRVLATASLDRS